MMPAPGPNPDHRYFRLDDRPYRLELVPGDERGIDALGFEVADDLELADLVGRLRAEGHKVDEGAADAAAERLVSGLAFMDGPSGLPLEFFYSPILDHVRVQTPLVSGFVTGEMGMGHVVLAVDDPTGTVDFFRGVLRFQLRNTGRVAGVGGRPERTLITFLGCNPRHHTVGVIGQDIPGNLLHLMLEVATIDDVGYALDRCADQGVSLAKTLGKHTNDHMVSYYCIAPDGVQIEYGWGGVHVDQPASETTYEITKGSLWGHRRQ
jgi:3,4-dihydroxy-9,10-secoandrosta-1,3,5(10)-triene-9,17-dione 4,5-dioxygenase